MSEKTITISLQLKENINSALKALTQNFSNSMSSIVKDTQRAKIEAESLSKKLEGVGAVGRSLAIGAGGIAGIFGLMGKKALDTAGQFEVYEKTLTTMLGSTEKAKKRMAEIEKFAWQTPFELDQVVEFANQLQVAGKYSEKMMTDLGDLAAASGKPLQQVAGAFAKLSTGQKGEAEMMFRDLLISSDDWQKATGKMVYTTEDMVNAIPKLMKDKNFTGMMSTITDSWKGMGSNFADTFNLLAKDIGEQLLPLAKIVLGFATQIIGFFRTLSPEMKKFLAIGGTMIFAVSALLTVFGGLLAILPSIASGFLILKNAVTLLSSGFSIQLVLIGALIVGLIYLYMRFENLRPIILILTGIFITFWAIASGGILPLIAGIALLVTGFFKLFEQLKNTTAISKDLKVLILIFTSITSLGVMPTIYALGKLIGAFINVIKAGGTIKEAFAVVWQGLIKGLALVAKGVASLIEKLSFGKIKFDTSFFDNLVKKSNDTTNSILKDIEKRNTELAKKTQDTSKAGPQNNTSTDAPNKKPPPKKLNAEEAKAIKEAEKAKKKELKDAEKAELDARKEFSKQVFETIKGDSALQAKASKDSLASERDAKISEIEKNFNAERAVLDSQKSTGEITEKQYNDSLLKLNESKNKDILASQNEYATQAQQIDANSMAGKLEALKVQNAKELENMKLALDTGLLTEEEYRAKKLEMDNQENIAKALVTQDRLNLEMETLRTFKDQELATLQTSFALGLISEQQYTQSKLAINDQYMKARDQKQKLLLAQDNKYQMLGLSQEQAFWVQKVGLEKQAGVIAQGFAIKDALVATYQAGAQALSSLPFPANLGALATVIASGMAQVSAIKAQSFAVGAVDIPQDQMAQIHKGEMIVPENFAQGVRDGSVSIGGSNDVGGEVRITIQPENFKEFLEATFVKASRIDGTSFKMA